MEPKLSIIIPMYRVEQFIRNCIDSCLAQIGDVEGKYEVIAVNDGSPDKSHDIALSYAPRISVISQENRGLGAARNAGIEVAKGEYLWFVDADDWISDDSVSRICACMDGKPDFIAIGAEMSGRIRQRLSGEITPRELFLGHAWRDCAPFYVYRRDFLEQNRLRFVEGIFHEDSEFTPRILYHAETCRVTEGIQYHIYENPNSITRSSNIKKSYDGLLVAISNAEMADAQAMDQASARRFHEHAVVMINCALKNLIGQPSHEIKAFEARLDGERELQKSFLRCRIIRYRIEYRLFRLSGGSYYFVFRFLNFFKRR